MHLDLIDAPGENFASTAPPAPLFADGFESGNASAWSVVVP